MSFKLLEVVLDSSLNFPEHVNDMCDEIARAIIWCIIHKLSYFFPIDILIGLYRGFVIPHFLYAEEAYYKDQQN